ncbi:MAG: flavin reductase family protein [Candidatus Omnitrophica bacterium]|nr:flavin reductase family protein [Candidatus Omnitrophota bacterium]
MSKRNIPPSEALYPLPVVLVSCLDRSNDKACAITIAWCGVIASKPPQIYVSIRPSRYSHKIIESEREFVVNIPSKDIMSQVDFCGTHSGRNTDKFKECSFKAIPSSKIASPMISECPVNIECRLKDILRLGSHDAFIGEVVAVHTDEKIIDEKGKIDYEKAKPFVYNQGEYWDLGKKIGYYGCSCR